MQLTTKVGTRLEDVHGSCTRFLNEELHNFYIIRLTKEAFVPPGQYHLDDVAVYIVML
jgi:hypothetical protein